MRDWLVPNEAVVTTDQLWLLQWERCYAQPITDFGCDLSIDDGNGTASRIDEQI